ncbi:MAG: ABC transporter substrate-binding protein [Proteobacteria bacterium]|nr:ABC transporter substrate-binding protein [Pseudomonadota bacterium]
MTQTAISRAQPRASILAVLGAIALSGWAQPSLAEEKVVRYVPSADVKVLDPIVNTAGVTLQHGYMIYDTLLSFDRDFNVRPQMLASYTVSADGLTYTMTLRPGLKWHDGAPVTTQDVVPSIKRWAARDSSGQQMVALGMTLAAVDDRTFTLTLKEKWGLVLDSLAKIASNAAFMMRAKEASTDPAVAVTETIGSGPFRFRREDYVPGSRVVYVRNTDYIARNEPPNFYAGSKAVKIDRLEWQVMPDTNTGISALNRGEVDFMEQPPVDLLPIVRNNKDVEIRINNKLGYLAFARPNFLHPPFNNEKARQALMHVINQEDFLRAAFAEPEFYKICWAFMACGTAMASEDGMDAYRKPDLERAHKLMQEAGYKGEKIVILHPTDLKFVHDLTTVLEQRMRDAGWNLDIQQMDWAAATTRRSKQEPPDQGGWNIFITAASAPEAMVVSGNPGLSVNCDRKGWFGWACDQTIQALRDQWSKEPDLAKRKEIATKTQLRAAEFVPYVILGQYFAPVAFRRSLTNVPEAPWPVFWAVEKR